MRRKSSEAGHVIMRAARPLAALAVVLAVLVAALLAGPAGAQGQALDAYRAEGIIAERYDGYVELRAETAPVAAEALVDEVNRKRRALYEQRAAESNVSVKEVGKLFATKIVEKAPPGTYFLKPDGGYARK